MTLLDLQHQWLINTIKTLNRVVIKNGLIYSYRVVFSMAMRVLGHGYLDAALLPFNTPSL